MGDQNLLLLIGLKILIIMTALQNIVILDAHARSTDVDGIKIFDKDDQAAKHSSYFKVMGYQLNNFVGTKS